MRPQLQRGTRQGSNRPDRIGHRNLRGRQSAGRRSRRSDQPHRCHVRRLARSRRRSGFRGGEKGRRADRHAQTQGGASAHGRYGRAAADPDRGHHARRVRRTGPQTGRAYRRGTACPDLLLRSRGVYAPATQSGRLPRRGIRGAARKAGARGVGARFRGASVRRGGSPHGRHDRRCARFPDRREFQPQYHLHAPRQRHRLRRARKGPSRPRGQSDHGQGGQGCRRQSSDAAGYAPGDQGYRLVYRGVRHRAGFDEHHRHRRNAATCRFRRGVPQGRCPRRACDGH